MSRPAYDYKKKSNWEPVRAPRERVHKKTQAATERAQNRPVHEKRAIWESIKREAPELAIIFKTFPGATVMSWEAGGKFIGEDLRQK